jgi:hypothetical protein
MQLARGLFDDEVTLSRYEHLTHSIATIEACKMVYHKLTSTPSHITNHGALSFSLFVSSSRMKVSDREEEDP